MDVGGSNVELKLGLSSYNIKTRIVKQLFFCFLRKGTVASYLNICQHVKNCQQIVADQCKKIPSF